MNEDKKWAKVSADIGYSPANKNIPKVATISALVLVEMMADRLGHQLEMTDDQAAAFALNLDVLQKHVNQNDPTAP